MYRKILATVLAAAGISLCSEPGGAYSISALYSYTSGGTSVRLESGEADGSGRCSYLGGKFSLRAGRGGECPEMLILHLSSIRGDARGLSCGYDEDPFGNVVFDAGRVRRTCPDLLGIERESFRVRWEHFYGAGENQADYWAGDRHASFGWDIEADYWGSREDLRAQVGYYVGYDWENRVPGR